MCKILDNREDEYNQDYTYDAFLMLKDTIKGMNWKRASRKNGYNEEAEQKKIAFGTERYPRRISDYRKDWLECLSIFIDNIIPHWDITNPIDTLPLDTTMNNFDKHDAYDRVLQIIAKLFHHSLFHDHILFHIPKMNNIIRPTSDVISSSKINMKNDGASSLRDDLEFLLKHSSSGGSSNLFIIFIID